MKTYALPIAVTFLALSLIGAVFFFNSQKAAGSVSYGSEYNSVYVTSSDANATTSIKTLPGSIGSVVVTEDGTAGYIDFFATTTAGQLQATSSNDLLFRVDGVAAEGTYEFDVAFGQTLMLDVSSGFDGQWVITYR